MLYILSVSKIYIMLFLNSSIELNLMRSSSPPHGLDHTALNSYGGSFTSLYSTIDFDVDISKTINK